jgi:hypothetical protein
MNIRFALTLSLVTLTCTAYPVVATHHPLIIEIWPGTVPNEAGEIGAERIRMSPKLDRKKVEVTESTRMLTNVTKPTIAMGAAPADRAGTAKLAKLLAQKFTVITVVVAILTRASRKA